MIKIVEKDIKRLLKFDGVSISNSVLSHYSKDESYQAASLPDIVVSPKSVQDISNIHKYCFENEINIIPYGQGSGLEGGVIPYRTANQNYSKDRIFLTLDLMKHMQKIVSVHPSPDRYCQVQAGCQRETLNSYIRDTGLWFPVDPGANATIGGMAATSASGTNAVRYGTMKENIINLEVVLPNGEIIHTAGEDRSTIKSSAGYNLTELFVGSEGTLGTIGQATLRLHPIDEFIAAGICEFSNLEDAMAAAEMALTLGVPVARMEFLDDISLRCVEPDLQKSRQQGSNVQLIDLSKTKAAIFFELSSSSENFLNEQIDLLNWIADETQGYNFNFSSDLKTRNQLWAARHRAYYSMLSYFNKEKPRQGYATDVCVPITKLSHCLIEAKKIMESSKFFSDAGGIIGHIGDGNFHVNMGVDVSDEEEYQEFKEITEKISRLALENNGTCTGEHGVGLGKKVLMKEQVGNAYGVMQLVKKSIDSKGIMNPGKVLL